MRILHFSKALSDETRLRLLRVLYDFELSVGELVEVLQLKQSRISRHLKILSEAGLLVSRRDGQWVYYRATESGAAGEYLSLLDEFITGEAALQEDADAAAQCVAARRQETAEFFGAIAEDWSQLRQKTLGGLRVEELVLSRMESVRCAVDLGCGTGELLASLAHKAARVIGVDNSPEMLAEAHRLFGEHAEASGRVSLRIGDLEHLPLADGEVDFAVMCLSLHHLAAPREGISEAFRVLSHSGRFVLLDFEKHEEESMRTESGDRWLGFAPEVVQAWLKGIGFEIAHEDRLPLPSGLVLRVFEALKR
ncbi:ArsR/SmtB family transcription factor [Desulfobaculum bizertense]|uniref:Transcriptional regulator, ArsR family n=1 Tax=Desulfobaculum bizertense DSM 18034 TaxID=1121442 RepID=A0A1T4WB87_9BACT|nr:metalloregulator ArsR/SmtB family transcription factor [Desulfobaculum bizertense]UIJ37507.1 metalloregulator ArsR/SmtB family transcription factor [Desulfobaculum bizertense]SKA74552.1 transcriptional regulator, ArsR family [Desulfobaculum bizertense DSM 18034]